MKRPSRYCLLLFLPLLLVCCKREDVIPPAEESAKDKLPWPLTQYMDSGYRPGDNFFMYCNGKYWKEASLGDKKIVGLFYTEMAEALEQKKASVSTPAYEQRTHIW